MNIRYALMAYLAAALVLLSIWLPEVAHYHVSAPSIETDVIRQAREFPSAAVLDELNGMALGVELDFSVPELIRAADGIARGSLRLSGYEPIAIGLPFDPADLDKGLPTWQLQFASLVAPEILLEAYAATGEERYFILARDIILAWIDYEESRWLPQGFLWNDHAIAARIVVLGKFWGAYRQRRDFDWEVAASLLEAITRNGEMLAKQGHFTYATNHGVMQNLALLHIAAAFPSLPAAQRFRQLAFTRLDDQMAFFVNDEGVVLEHSAGYHSHGMALIAKALRYLTLNGIAPPAEWLAKYEKGKAFMAMIHRPDGTLPVYGNTNGGRRPYIPVTSVDGQGRAEPLRPQKEWHPAAAQGVYPVAGYSVWWDNLAPDSAAPPVQTVLAWSNFSGHGHKLADEMSLLLWSGDQTWLTNTGYWPYGVWGRDQVYSWEGSNAPHLVGEARNSERTTALRGYAVQDKLAISHLRRSGPDGYAADRQVLHIGADLWLVLDHTVDAKPRKTTTTWTFSPDLDASPGAFSGEYRFTRGNREACMAAYFLGSPAVGVVAAQGSKTPFAGWVVVGSQPQPAPALIVEQPSAYSWAMTVLALEPDCRERFGALPKLSHWNGTGGWQASLPLRTGEVEIERVGNSFRVRGGSAATGELPLVLGPAPDVSADRRTLDRYFQSASAKYEKFSELYEYRLRLTYLLLALLLGQEASMAVCVRFARGYQAPLRIVGIAAWIMGGGLIYFVYLKI